MMFPTSALSLLLSLCAALALCQCSTKTEKPKSTSEMTLQQRATLKPNQNQRSQFEKYITGSKGMKGSAGNYYQKQMHHSKSFGGGNSYAGQKQFKAGQSWFGKSKASGMDMTYALGDHQSSMGRTAFKADASRMGRQEAREAGSAFNGGGNIFKTGSALTRAEGMPEAPLIIEDRSQGSSSGKKAAYTEDEVKKLLGR